MDSAQVSKRGPRVLGASWANLILQGLKVGPKAQGPRYVIPTYRESRKRRKWIQIGLGLAMFWASRPNLHLHLYLRSYFSVSFFFLLI